jgi:molybdopterin-containing oxidoreductase family iron-sulfur binding subunit
MIDHDHDHAEPRHDEAVTRREFLRLASASIALAGLDGCTRMPAQNILPYVDNRPELTPGVAQYYATAMCIDGCATGLLVASHNGRPTKIEGNPDHPASLGASSAIHQASVLGLYDPDRATHARIGSSRAGWDAIGAMLAPSALRSRVGSRGRGLRLLIEPSSSPLDEGLLGRVLDTYPDAAIHMYAPLVADRTTSPLVTHYEIALADVILAIDSDFLATGPFHLQYARRFADGRRLASPSDKMNRLYAVESSFTSTGAAADHRVAMRPRDIPRFVDALLAAVTSGESIPNAPNWLRAVAADLVGNKGRSLVIAGDGQPVGVRHAVATINAAIGATGRTTWQAPSPLIGGEVHISPFAELVDALRSRSVDTLIIVGGNPLYTVPSALNLSSLVRAVPNAGYLGLYENETARDVRWFMPMSHYLETWGDARAYDGTLSIVQPLVNPLYESISPAVLYSVLGGAPINAGTAYDLLQASWKKRTAGDADAAWDQALRRGIVDGSAFASVAYSQPSSPATIAAAPLSPDATVDVVYSADPKVHDGAYANNGWLQELPAPMTQLTWGNAGLLSPATAHRLGVNTGQMLALSAAKRRIEIPALIVPGHADETITVHFGYGRRGAESVAKDVGADTFAFWPAVGVSVESGVSATRLAGAQKLAIAQPHSTMEANRPVRSATLEQYRAAPAAIGQRAGRALSLYPNAEPAASSHAPQQWAMTIDLATCIGCGACVVACQAENNVPVVGAGEVRNGRQMHWLRIDRYFESHETEVDALLQPMLCQHCEKAPCEYVCPVEATVHSDDGLNEMVYNRCVGTRFCSNNCPYKVRRFNWFDYNARLSETELMVKNPNVTVRERGVMEKCTFCVQRIREAEIAAGRDGRDMRGSEVRTACQQSCPTNAIVFGSLAERDSEMVRRREQPRAYSALADLGTEPRVRYLARIRNPNDKLRDAT